MPIIIEGGSRCAGWWWARHLQNTEANERAELVAVEGLSAETMPEMFREMRGLATGTKCENYFYQANINPRADEHLSPAQWREAVETLGRNLGLEGQPYFVIEHEKAGRVHRHVVWSRIDQERQVAISDSLTAQIHEQTARQLEIKFDLQRGRSILVPNREFARPERLAKKHERFRGAQSGIDPRMIGAELKALRERCDNGQSFRAGMEAAGYVLARGDRRDFLVIDQAGKEHSLARLISMKAAALRTFMKGIYAGSLPSVVEAKSRQMTRQVAQEAHQKHSAAERGAGQDTRRTDGPENAEKGAAKAERPLSAAIRRAWSLSRTGDQLTEALAARGIGLACVTAGEARTNHRRRAFAKQVGRYAQPLREGEIVAVNEQGYVFRFSPRTAGVDRGEIKKRLAGFEAGGLLSLSDTRQVMREVRADDPAATRLHSVTEARSQFKIDRRAIAAVHDELAQQQLERATEVTADPLQEREPADRDLPEPDGIATAAADIATKALNVMLDFAASFIAAPPPLTGEQLRERGEAAKDERGRQTARQETNERLATTVDMGRAARARADREEEEKRERQRRREQEEEYGRDR